MSLHFDPSSRLAKLPPYAFAEIERTKARVLSEGVDLINLSIGDPDLPPPQEVIEALKEALKKEENHKYPIGSGLPGLKKEISSWFKKRFGTDIDPEKEVLILWGSKDGLSHLPFALLDEGDISLIPNPAYVVYQNCSLMSGAITVELPLKEKNGFLADPFSLDPAILNKARILFINYPNNPTSAIATKEYYQKLVDFCKKNNILICSDNAYSELYFNENDKPCSVMEIEGARDTAVEFHSFSKTFNMTGWRLGFAVGNREVLKHLAAFKENIDSGVFLPVQYAGIEALRLSQEKLDANRNIFKERRDVLTQGLEKLGIEVIPCKATFYLWVKTPGEIDSTDFVSFLLEKYGILGIPGSSLGKHGEGYIRFALTVSVERIQQALSRMQNLPEDLKQFIKEREK